MNPFRIVLIPTLLCFSILQAQDPGDQIFEKEGIHEIEFSFNQNDYWQTMERDFQNNFGGDIPYIMADVTIDGEIVDSVGVRFKGFTSYPEDSDKKPFKIDFNEFVQGQRFDGLRKLNLNNGFGDPAMQRDVLCYKMLREMGVKAPRTSWAHVSINGEYWGLYILIEQVDKEFLDSNFSNPDGNLFKNKGWSHFEWLGSNQMSYDTIFDLKTNEMEDDWAGFVELMRFLNNSSSSEFQTELEDKFNVDLFLKTLAVDVATNNWDSYLEHGRNWYIYEDDVTGIFNWIPWDYNFSLEGTFDFGGGGGGGCFIFQDIIHYSGGTTTVEFQDLGFAEGTPTYYWDFGDGNTSTQKNPIHTYNQAGIYTVTSTVTVSEDCIDITTIEVDTDYNPAECTSVTNGSFPYEPDIVLQTVLSFNPSCCSSWSSNCEEEYIWIYDFINEDFNFGSSNFLIDQSDNSGVLIRRLLEVPEFKDRYYTYFCDLLSNVMTEGRMFDIIDFNKELIMSSVESDPNNLYGYDRFLEDISHYSDEEGLKQIFTNRIVELREELDSSFSCSNALMNLEYQEATINELVASNDSIGGVADPSGGYPDWIEIYNNSGRLLDLSSVFLSDKKSNLRKWEFPAGTSIPPDDYIIVWADNDISQPGIHSNFKLSKSGESIYLSNADGSIIDSVGFSEQRTNVAYARVPNGTGNFRFWTPTNKMSNDLGMTSTQEVTSNLMSIYPNPANQTFTLMLDLDTEHRLSKLEIFNVNGTKVMHQEIVDSSTNVNVSALVSGLYNVRMYDRRGNRFSKNLIIQR